MELEDGRKALLQELVDLKSRMDYLKSEYLKHHEVYLDRKKRYEALDRAWADRDGRLKVIVQEKKEKKQTQLTQEEINSLIEELSSLIDK